MHRIKWVKINTEVWEKDIRKAIAEWEDFSESTFCDTKERQQAAKNCVSKLQKMLETLQTSNRITKEQFEWFTMLTR